MTGIAVSLTNVNPRSFVARLRREIATCRNQNRELAALGEDAAIGPELLARHWRSNEGRNIQWGLSESPLVLSDRILVAPGGRDAAIVALRKSDGALIWRSQDDEPGYSSALLHPVGDVQQAIWFTAGRALGIDVSDGRLLYTGGPSSILMTAIPVGTLLFAVLGRQERLTVAKAASFAVALIGVLLVLRPAATELAGASLAGDLLTVTNALSYSLFLVISKRVLERVDALAATAVLLAFGTVGMLLPGLPALRGFDPTSVSLRTWALGAFIVVFPTALAYLLNYWALARVQSSTVAFFIYLQPLIATTLSVAFLDDRLDGWMVAGAALVFLAVYLALRPDRS